MFWGENSYSSVGLYYLCMSKKVLHLKLKQYFSHLLGSERLSWKMLKTQTHAPIRILKSLNRVVMKHFPSVQCGQTTQTSSSDENSTLFVLKAVFSVVKILMQPSAQVFSFSGAINNFMPSVIATA